LVDWVECKSVWVVDPEFADGFVGCEAPKGLESPSEVVGCDEVRTAEDKLYLFVAIDRTSKFAVVELVEKADMQAAAAFLEALVEAVPYRIHTVLTNNGIQFAICRRTVEGLRQDGVDIPSIAFVFVIASATV
jgi:hypothetical protein